MEQNKNKILSNIKQSKQELLLGFLYGVLAVVPLVFMTNQMVIGVLLSYIFIAYIYLGRKHRNILYYFTLAAVIMMTVDLVVVYTEMEEGFARTMLALLTAFSVYGVIITCIVNIVYLFKRKVSFTRLVTIVRLVVMLFLFDAMLRTIGLHGSSLTNTETLTYNENFSKLIIVIYMWELVCTLLNHLFRNKFKSK